MSGHRNFKELQKELEQRPDYAEKAAAARERHALEDATYEQADPKDSTDAQVTR